MEQEDQPVANDEKLQRFIPSLVVIGVIILTWVFYSMYLVHKEQERFLSPVSGGTSKIRIIKDSHQGFILLGYSDNAFVFEMEPESLTVWQKTKRVTALVIEGKEKHVIEEMTRNFPLSSQEFNFDSPTVELYQSEPYSGVIYIAYDKKTHRGVMREYMSIMGGS